MRLFKEESSMKHIKFIVTASLCLLPLAALGQDTSTSSFDLGNFAWNAVCSNPSISKPIFAAVGLYIMNNVGNAIMKKYGLTKDSPYIGWLVWGMRKIATDVHPPAGVVMQNAADVGKASPGIVAMTGINPDKMAAAAEALKTAAKTS
jgi:hypothetical protein